jgi:hypothetical protein
MSYLGLSKSQAITCMSICINFGQLQLVVC